MPNARRRKRLIEAEGGVEVARHRHGATFRMPDGTFKNITWPQQSPMHTLTGEESDTDLDADGDTVRTRSLDYQLRRSGPKRVRFTPRPDYPGQYIDIGMPRIEQASGWRAITTGAAERTGSRVTFTGSHADVLIDAGYRAPSIRLRLKGEAANRRILWPHRFTGCRIEITVQGRWVVVDDDGTPIPYDPDFLTLTPASWRIEHLGDLVAAGEPPEPYGGIVDRTLHPQGWITEPLDPAPAVWPVILDG